MADLPAFQPLDAVTAPVATGGGPGRIIALVASERSISEGWAPGAAHQLAKHWAASGARLILADGGLERPSLHEAVGQPNREGLVDAVLYGASVGRIATAMDEGYFLITAGTPSASPVAVVRGPRLHRYTTAMVEAGINLVLYLREGDPCTPAFLGSASDIIVLGTAEDAPPSSIRDLEPLVRSVTGPADATRSLPRESSPPLPSTEARPKATGGKGRLVLFVVLAVVAAVVLGVLLTSGVG